MTTRSTDGPWERRAGLLLRVWQNVVPLICIAIAAYAVLGVESKQDRQREGRAVSVDVTCGFANGLAEAVTQVFRSPFLGQQTPQQMLYQRNLEKLGAPSIEERRVAAIAQAREFARTISESVADEAGAEVARVVNAKDGTLNCTVLRKVADTVPPPANATVTPLPGG